jgi:hypothetical protein
LIQFAPATLVPEATSAAVTAVVTAVLIPTAPLGKDLFPRRGSKKLLYSVLRCVLFRRGLGLDSLEQMGFRLVVKSSARYRLVLAVLLALCLPSAASGSLGGHKAPWWSRSFESPETLPARYPFCCGTYWYPLLSGPSTVTKRTANHLVVSDPNPSSAHPPRVVSKNASQIASDVDLTVDPNDIYITGSGATSTRVDVYMNARSALARNGLDEWEHAYFMLPSALDSPTPYHPVAGNWNWLLQWHSASSIIGGQSVTGGQPFAMGVQTGASFTDSGCGYRTSTSSNAELFGYFTGGNIAKGPQPQHKWCLNKPLQLDHWYDVYLHIIWSKSSITGLFYLEIDGSVVADRHQATLLYNSSTGATDIPNVELSNYRGPDPTTGSPPTWSSTVYYDGVRVGTTKLSVK